MDKTDTNNIDICLEDLTYTDEPLEVRTVVLSKILKELALPYKKYYTKKSQRSFRRVKKPDVLSDKDLTVTFSIQADKSHIDYAKWLFDKRMNEVTLLYRAYFAKPTDN